MVCYIPLLNNIGNIWKSFSSAYRQQIRVTMDRNNTRRQVMRKPSLVDSTLQTKDLFRVPKEGKGLQGLGGGGRLVSLACGLCALYLGRWKRVHTRIPCCNEEILKKKWAPPPILYHFLHQKIEMNLCAIKPLPPRRLHLVYLCLF